ncbi:variable surface lipoprotein [Mycoplasma bovis]|uniref:Putative lipoprotein n=1 Tax=Mycoplasmopsis bovis (strain ATCC 25523 / DSM 22781 / NCTC 10131 / PG45) TaxID=289397 RepID=A0A454ANW6_MYCBG|nr:variable surface lipoprotein [Mycoplasmopsis bovis]ADR24739.1 putative lipoprotein [Mycoplasmopsis bovis PG45]MBT1368110.1 variable surface lipoprotein [Mycoplasmopsis bovis]QLI75525.1 variable surface lipoprotein [Mycoplasmopsis bovis]QUE42114.1 variable surface lipoprotein [Mycoplasmopsis bovis]QUE42400.1 variable surface lipoprotein [Mycoplasmopsis bovis]
MKHKLLLSLGTVLTATFSFPLIATKCDGSNKKEEKKKVEEPAKQAEGAGTGHKTTSASGTSNSNGASSNSANAQKTNEKEIKETSDSHKKDGEKVSDNQEVAYKDIDFDLSKVKIIISKKDIKDEDLIPPKKGNNKQVFFDTRNGATKLSGKFKRKLPWKGIKIGTVTGLPDGYSIAGVENPIHKTRKGEIKASGFVNVEKEGDKLKIKFRFFKYNKGASPTVSTKVYEAIIS